jgi:predicted ribosome quality control (RQC) complex YloA/Tae2 family protein
LEAKGKKMTKGEIRKARKEAREQGQALTGDLKLKQEEFSETYQGYRAGSQSYLIIGGSK